MFVRRSIAGLAAAVAAVAIVAIPGTASADPHDHQDPYATGCANGSFRVTPKAPITSRADGTIGHVWLMWSPSCQTNWTEITVASSATGSIAVHTGDGRNDQFNYQAGRTHHWGNMLHAPGICAWGSATVAGAGGTNGSGATQHACD